MTGYPFEWLRRTGQKKSGGETPEAAPEREDGPVTARADMERFFPRDLLKLLKLKSWSDITAGRQQLTNSVIMDMNTAGFSEFVHGRQAREVFDSINVMLAGVLPLVCGPGGLVESFSGGGFTALYEESFGGAASAAVSVSEELLKLQKTRPEYAGISVGLHFGPVMLGAVGNESRMTLLTISEAKEFTAFLRSIGPKYGCRILASDDFMGGLQAAGERFNCRLLGTVSIQAAGGERKIYEIFDGDEVERRNYKRRTRIVFEKGVTLYRMGKIREARLHFIEVLKTDRLDRAARTYLQKCDAGLSGEGTPYIEMY